MDGSRRALELREPGQRRAERLLVEKEQRLSAWFCAAAATSRSRARWLRNAVTSSAPSPDGCRLPEK